MPHALVQLEYLDHNPQIILELIEQFLRILAICVSTPPGKAGKGSNIFWGKNKLVLYPLTGLMVCLNFANIYSCLRYTLAQPLKYEEQKEENRSCEPQINVWFVGCIYVQEAVIWGKEMRACTHKRDNSGNGVIILEENLVQIGLIVAEISHLMKCDLDLYYQGQLI